MQLEMGKIYHKSNIELDTTREHRYDIENYIDKSVPIYLNQPKHTLNDVEVIPLLHVNSNRDSIRLSIEQHLIDKAGTLQNGINRTCNH